MSKKPKTQTKELTFVEFGGKSGWMDGKKIYRWKPTPSQSDWEEEFDCEFTEKETEEEALRNMRIKSFISAQIQQARAETLKEAIAYLIKKNPVRVPSSVMVDYTEAITDLEKLSIKPSNWA